MKESSFKNRNVLVIIFEVLVVILGITGITYATSKLISDRATTLLTTGEYNVDYVGKNGVTATGLEPISDELVNYNTTDKVVRLEFSLKGVSTNKKEDNLIYDIMLNEMNIDCSLLNKYTKWNLYKNGSLLSTGSFDPKFDGNVLSENLRLTEIQEKLPKHDEDYDKYVFIIWVSEACEDLEKCELVDQSAIVNSNLSMKVFVALYSGAKKKIERVPNYDTSCANRPELYDNMLAVTYKDGEWVLANKDNNSNELVWYDYGISKWANAVVVKKGSKYSNKKDGTIIDKDDILAQYVWIPRYKYMTWNIEEKITDSYDAYNKGINIVFENGLAISSGTKNNQYLTHPAFGTNLKGLWISKYELSNNYGVKFISGVESYKGLSLNTCKDDINNLVNTYNLGDKVDSHIVTNLEWGATLYLSHSKYGVCLDGSCDTIGMNMTYISGNNKQDTTTRNVYGVYDMAGGSGEYVFDIFSIGTATDEVTLPNGNIWYKALSVNNNEYLIRGGFDRGLFYYGGPNMTTIENSTRGVLTSK